MPPATTASPTAAELLAQPALLTLRPDGQAYLNREASRQLPPGLTQVRLSQPTTLGQRWWLLPGVPGGPKVQARADRLGYLRFRAPLLAAYAFAIQPAGTKLLRFELVPVGGFFQLHPLAEDGPAQQPPPP